MLMPRGWRDTAMLKPEEAGNSDAILPKLT